MERARIALLVVCLALCIAFAYQAGRVNGLRRGLSQPRSPHYEKVVEQGRAAEAAEQAERAVTASEAGG